jgi:hypothetical protein
MPFSVDCIDVGKEESASMLDEQVEDGRAWYRESGFPMYDG